MTDVISPPATLALSALTARSAAIEARSGAMVTYRKHKPLGDCLDDMGPTA